MFSKVINNIKEKATAIEHITKELHQVEVIEGKRVQEIIIENGGKIVPNDSNTNKTDENIDDNKQKEEKL